MSRLYSNSAQGHGGGNYEPINSYELMDLRGRRLLTGSGTSATILLDLGGLPAEVYMLRLETGSG